MFDRQTYDRLFAIEELAKAKRLQLIFYGLIVAFIFNLDSLRTYYVGATTELGGPGRFCPDYFQTCYAWIPFHGIPMSYDYDIFFMILFGLLLGSLGFALNLNWRMAHALLVPVFVADAVIELFFTTLTPMSAFLLFPSFVFLFCKHKKESLMVLCVALYVMAGMVKLHESWIAGSYFSTLRLGLPMFPRSLIPLFTNLVVIMELIGSWFLLSGSRLLRHLVLTFFIAFHLYSVSLVGFRYPISSFVVLLPLFWGDEKTGKSPAPLALVFISVLFLMNLRPYFIEKDHKVSLEGISTAIWMYDGNRQTLVEMKKHFADGQVKSETYGHINPYIRMNPFNFLQFAKYMCLQQGVTRVEWKMDVSLNGHPFRRIVDEQDACSLQYNLFAHNPWIHVDGEVVGYPDYNFYNPGALASGMLPVIYDQPRIMPEAMEAWFAARTDTFIQIYATLAILVGIGSVAFYVRRLKR